MPEMKRGSTYEDQGVCSVCGKSAPLRRMHLWSGRGLEGKNNDRVERPCPECRAQLDEDPDFGTEAPAPRQPEPRRKAGQGRGREAGGDA